MTSMFESAVYVRERQTPWARVSLLSFIQEMVWNGADQPLDNPVSLTAHYRHDVSSRIWYSLEWTGADGERHSVEAQSFDKLLWRAAEREMQTQERMKKQKEEAMK